MAILALEQKMQMSLEYLAIIGIEETTPNHRGIVTIWSSKSTRRYIVKRNQNMYLHKNLYISDHSSNSQKIEITQMSIN